MPDLTELDAVGFAKRNVAPYISPVLDTYTLSLVCKDLGLTGKAIPKVIDGRQYIILRATPVSESTCLAPSTPPTTVKSSRWPSERWALKAWLKAAPA